MATRLDSEELCTLPPGMVPSKSRSDLNGRSNKEEKPTITAYRGAWQARVGVMHNPDTNKPSSKLPFSKESEIPPVFHIDLDSEINDDGGTARVKVKGPSWQTLSPWRRKNKVAPSPLQSSSDSTLLNEKENARPRTTGPAVLEETDSGRPLSAPLNKKIVRGNNIGTVEIYSETTPVSIKPIEISEPTYSQVKKRDTGSPPPLPPRLGGNPRYISSPQDSETNHVISILSRTSTSGSDSLYESLKDEEEQQYSEIIGGNPRLYKDLKKHKDDGNVQLISIEHQSSFAAETNQGQPLHVGAAGPLHAAAAKGDKKELSVVLSTLPMTQDPVEMVLGSNKFCRREKVDERDGKGRSALMHAVHHGHYECVQLLANAGANINLEFADGSTCLHEAAYSSDIKMIALLLSLGADGLKRDKDGRVPLHWSTHNYNPESIHLLLDKVPGLSANVPDSTKMTPLMWAAFHGRPLNIEALKERGGDPKLVDCDGMRAVHWSVKSHDKSTLKALLTTKSSEYQDFKGRTVINHAAEAGFAKAIEIIKNVRPQSVNDKDHNGRTPLHWAAVCEKPDVIRALLAAGTDINIKDVHGYTSLDYAIEKGHTYCALLLQQEQESTQYVLTLGEGTGIGVRTLIQQEGKVIGEEVVNDQLTEEHVLQLKAVCTGAWMNKFTTEGKGPVHPRFFWIDPTTLKIHWAKSIEARYLASKDTKTGLLVGVRSSASTSVLKRKDFDPVTKHKFAFTIFAKDKVLDVLALSSEDFKTWLNGLQLLLSLGSEKAIQVINRSSTSKH